MIDDLKKNVDTEIEILREIASYVQKRETATDEDKKLLDGAINSLSSSMKLINQAIPGMVRQISIAAPLPSKTPTSQNLQDMKRISFQRSGSNVNVVLNNANKEQFLKELSISDSFVRKLKKRSASEVEKYEEFKAARGYLKISNRLFFDRARNFVSHGRLNTLSTELQRADMDILFESYVAMMMLTTLIAAVSGFVLAIFLLLFTISFSAPFISMFAGDYLIRFAQVIWIPIAAPIVTFAVLYYYPSTERKSLEKKIDQELPFAVIHMSAIAGSGIEPSEIFRIIGLSKEYPALRREIRKVINQINLYGYDLVTALNNASKSAPSEKLAELFSGLSTSITSGASLTDFFAKRAESLLVSFRLDREKYTKIAETFMDIYISVVIAAPMILLLLLIIISVSNMGLGLSSGEMGLGVVTIVALLNLLFLGFLQMRQPTF